MMAPASFPLEKLPCLLGRLDIGPPPGLEHLAPSKPQGTATTVFARHMKAIDSSPMYVNPLLLEPVFLSIAELSPRTVDPDVADEVPDWSSQARPLRIKKWKQDLSLGGMSDCSTAIPAVAATPSWASAVDADTETSASTTASTAVSPQASESSSTTMPLFDHSMSGAVGFCGNYSKGSVLHAHGTCKPCDFSHRGGCRAGIDCPFCHLCTAADAKRKRKELKKAARQLRQ
eukprot:TRINITY_DN2716_c0_g1_i11.p1 TRINITY_DN2716_c0_g1~~TRINITY_DN2716_c0_g1_i11.p1  ORF type:complete len:231 (-),score=54.62 TRINITY_DN2716_c0_g1_i11:957-1649(-)